MGSVGIIEFQKSKEEKNIFLFFNLEIFVFVWSSDEKLRPNIFLLLKTFSPSNDLGNGGFSNMWSQSQICTGCFFHWYPP